MRASLSHHRFGIGPALAVGVEEELLAVEPRRLGLVRPPALEGRDWSVLRPRPEVCDAMVELATPICESAAEAVDVLALARRELAAAGVLALGTGVHPAAAFGDARPGPDARYAAIFEALRGLLARTPYCGMHVHVGMPDAEMAIRACNGMRKWVPLLIALGANSPYWHGRDSGLASARVALMRSLPRVGVPRAFRDYEDFAGVLESLFEAGEFEDETAVWWMLRPHPRLGTLEVRVPDTQSSLRDATGLVALIHCLAVHEGAVGDDGGPPPEELDECCFRAMRDGRAAVLRFEGELQPVAEVARTALARVRPQAFALRCADELEEVGRLLRDGNGADRQRAAFRRGGIPAVLRALAEETRGAPAASLVAAA